ncbi:MAG: DNA polymerase III subunit beta [Endomicrobiia bacterium]
MKLNVTKSNLQRALAAVSKAVSTKPTIEILKNIDLNANKGVLRVAATDLELSISTYIGVDMIEEGATTVLAKTFIEFVSLLPDGNISLILENNELKVETEKIKSKFSTIPHDEFPELPQVDDSCQLIFKIEKGKFIQSVEKTTFAADRSGISQPVFTGVLFEQTPGKLNIVSTDRFRLSKYSIEVDNDSKIENAPIIPYNALENISRLCQESEDDFVEGFLVNKNNQVLFKSGRIEVSSSLIDGEFPNYQAFMPQKTLCTYKVNVQAFIDAVKLSNVFAKTEDSLKIVFQKTLDSDHLLLSSRVSEVGEYETELDVEVIFEEEGIDINFSPKKVLDILSRITTENVYLDIVVHPRTEHRMLIFREENNDNFIHLLTPLVGA